MKFNVEIDAVHEYIGYSEFRWLFKYLIGTEY